MIVISDSAKASLAEIGATVHGPPASSTVCTAELGRSLDLKQRPDSDSGPSGVY